MSTFDRLPQIAATGSPLAQRAQWLDTVLLLVSGAAAFRITIRHGVVVSVETGPFVMPSYDFSLSATPDEWARFLSAEPPPGAHDLMALLRRGTLQLAGNLHPLMANLMYFKLLFAGLRAKEQPA